MNTFFVAFFTKMANTIHEKRDDLESMTSTKYIEDVPYSGIEYVI